MNLIADEYVGTPLAIYLKHFSDMLKNVNMYIISPGGNNKTEIIYDEKRNLYIATCPSSKTFMWPGGEYINKLTAMEESSFINIIKEMFSIPFVYVHYGAKESIATLDYIVKNAHIVPAVKESLLIVTSDWSKASNKLLEALEMFDRVIFCQNWKKHKDVIKAAMEAKNTIELIGIARQ